MFWRVQRLLTGLSRRSWFFGRSGHRVGVLCLHKTTPYAGAVHVAGLCDRDWVQRNTLGNATQAIKQKITRQTWGMCEQKNISHFLLDKLDFNLNYVFVYKVFCKIIPNLNTQHKTSGKTWSPIVSYRIQDKDYVPKSQAIMNSKGEIKKCQLCKGREM